MRPRFWVAYGALALALALLVPTLAPLSGSMDAFAQDLANGTFRPFGPPAAEGALGSGSLGGFTGQSTGDYVPGSAELPESWVLDRDGRGGNVVIDTVFNPALGAMKRLKAYDRVSADGSTLEVADTRLRPYTPDPLRVTYDTPMDGSFPVQLRAGEPVAIYSPHPRPAIRAFSTSPPVPGGIAFFQDGADTLYVRAEVDLRITLNLSLLTERAYYEPTAMSPFVARDYPLAARPSLPPSLVEDAQIVLARAGVSEDMALSESLARLATYFRSFTEGDIAPPTEVESLYLALATSGHGCCRHRAFGFMVTAQAIGVPARVIVNEAHAFAEVMLPGGAWRQINLGGCGTYEVNNPNQHRSLFQQANEPREEANPLEDRPRPAVATFTNITGSPSRIVKGETYYVSGTVEIAAGRPAAGARVDVYLNETKDTPGRLTGAGVADATGRFSVAAKVPRDLPARSYQLVARAQDPGTTNLRYLESWSDPEVSVFAPTALVIPRLAAAAGFPADITGRLTDLDGNPVKGERIGWDVDGQPQASVTTDATGRFRATPTFESIGVRNLTFVFAGSEHHGEATTTAMLSVERGAILLPTEAPTFARGETSSLTGRVAIAGANLTGQDVIAQVTSTDGRGPIRIVAEGRASPSGRQGSFTLPLAIPADIQPGIYPVRVVAPGLDLEGDTLIRIAIRPTLVLEAPRSVGHSDTWFARATLESDNGTPLAAGLVELTIDRNTSTTQPLLTNRTGVARFEIAGRSALPGAHDIVVAFPGDATHANASANARVEWILPWYAAIPPLAYAAAAALLATSALVAWALRTGGPVRVWAAAAIARRRKRWVIEASFPDHPPGVPPFHEPGDKVRISIRVRRADGSNVPARIHADWLGGRAHGRAEGHGWLLDLTAPAEGPLTVTARARGLARAWTRPLEIHLPVGSYRLAVEAGFVELRSRAQLLPSASPGDLVRVLGPRLPSAQQKRLRDVAALFEAADYSERAVDRAYYHAFALAVRDLERSLEARPDGG